MTNPQTKADLAFMSWLTMEQPTLLGKSTDGSPGIGQSFVTYLMKQPRGTVNVELRYSAMCFGPAGNGQPKKQPAVELARGKVSFNVTESAIAAYESANGMARTAVAFAHSGDAKHIEAEARALVKGKPVVAFFMAQREWNIKRNEYGRIMSREAEGTIVVRDTTICLAYDFLAIEANTGADDFVETPALRDPTFGSKPTGTPISCQSIPKTN